jgi:hypothetical protein
MASSDLLLPDHSQISLSSTQTSDHYPSILDMFKSLKQQITNLDKKIEVVQEAVTAFQGHSPGGTAQTDKVDKPFPVIVGRNYSFHTEELNWIRRCFDREARHRLIFPTGLQHDPLFLVQQFQKIF